MPEPVRLKQHLRVETIGDEVVVFDRDSGESISRLTGDAVEALRLLQAAQGATSLPERLSPAVAELAGAGIVEHPGGISRRDALIKGGKAAAVVGAAWTAASVTSFRLADPAMAASPCPDGTQNPTLEQKYTSAGTFTYTTWSGETTLLVRCWGAGGGGGGAGWSLDGGGGGGGAYASASVTVSPCTTYTVAVGTGGGAGTTGGGLSRGGDGGNGGTTQFRSGGSVLLTANGGSGGRGARAANTGNGGNGGAATTGGGVTSYKGGNGYRGGGGGGGAGSGSAGSNGADPDGGDGGTGNPGTGSYPGKGGSLSHSGGHATYGWHGNEVGGGGGAGDYNLLSYYAPGAGARGELWVGI